MIFETERLYVRKWNAKDLHDLHELFNDSALNEDILTKVTIAETESIFQNQVNKYNAAAPFGRYFIIEKASDHFVGLLLFKKRTMSSQVEIGYSLKKNHWKKGYATEVVKESIKWIFKSKDYSSIYAVTGSLNENSKNVLRRCGFLPGERFMEYGEELDVFDLHERKGCQ